MNLVHSTKSEISLPSYIKESFSTNCVAYVNEGDSACFIYWKPGLLIVIVRCNLSVVFPIQIEEYERSLGECRLLISQHEARCASLAESMREAENKKRQLEEAADALREECARLQVRNFIFSI